MPDQAADIEPSCSKIYRAEAPPREPYPTRFSLLYLNEKGVNQQG